MYEFHCLNLGVISIVVNSPFKIIICLKSNVVVKYIQNYSIEITMNLRYKYESLGL